MNLRYLLTISASDLGTPPKSATASVYILVSEVNRNSPRFIGNAQAFQATIPETRPVGSTIGKVTATDDDAGMNGKINYVIVSGDSDGMFEIDRDEGYLSIAKGLDYETRTAFHLNVTASDRGAVVKSIWRIFSVNITD